MSIKILMPDLSPTMTEGNLSKWLVKEGDNVKAGDVIAEIETDKATMEVEAVDEGKITHLLQVNDVKKIPVNSVIAIIDGDKDENIEDQRAKTEQIHNLDSGILEKNSVRINNFLISASFIYPNLLISQNTKNLLFYGFIESRKYEILFIKNCYLPK